MVTMKKRVYGVVGIASHMANWNADFTGRPKTIGDGTIFGSDKALKYSVKNFWEKQGEKVLFYKSYTIPEKSGEKIQPRNLTERYDNIFGGKLDDKTSSKDVLNNLFSALDVLNFGATFAVEKQNIALTGVVQVGQGMNKYEDTDVQVQDILSPFRNSKKQDADASSLGKKIVSDEAHYVYPFSVNPNHYDEYIDLLDGFEGYTVEAYEKLREGLMKGATVLNTNSKSGAENELALFVTCKEGTDLYLPQLDQYIGVYKGSDGKIVYDFEALSSFLQSVQADIEQIELFYNPYKVAIENSSDAFIKKHLYTREELK
ncbi:type I CRISPR-associated protein Cas7 [Lederbergia sp. NSJ-179]|uniref:type I CRISPR-associated protein Cas7 n=1 Tax=Lederbergia sp. NSJ-179 TaxID=2931402 RepID=UPI001FCFB593|nr:type I CRISPR-associated protein Cas7 [Lederbergia sp. NSJ-179]MCJ7840940.1 type I CRISPR-associated protein Cas7 [Lederbergia sp. NSJ-179]